MALLAGRADSRQAEALLRQSDRARSGRAMSCMWRWAMCSSMHGHFDEAIAAFDRALALNPLQAVEPISPRSRRRNPPRRIGPGSTGCWPQLGTAPASTTRDRVSLHFADRQGARRSRRIPAGDVAFRPGQRDQAADRPVRGAGAAREHVDRLVARFTPDFFAAGEASACDDETPLLVLGMPRSGTTLTEQIVSSHPAVVGGGELPLLAGGRRRPGTRAGCAA